MRGVLMLVGLTLLTACPGPIPPPVDPVGLPTKPNFYLRVSFDQDPSVFLGRYVPPEASKSEIDETAAMQMPCSKFFTVRKVAAGGVEFDEYFNASTSAAASIGIPGVVSGGVSAGRGKVVRIKYTSTEKWIAHIEDMAGYQKCCMLAPGQCGEEYIGEFLAGTGEIYAGYNANAGVGGSYNGVKGEIKDGVEWHRAVVFKNPVFFAFKTTKSPGFGGNVPSGQCQHQFRNAVPKSPLGVYFVGLSEWVPSERSAREFALLDARQQVIRFLGERIVQAGHSSEVTQGQLQALQIVMKDERFMERASGGVARFVKDECWENEVTTSPDGTKYMARVLAFIPNEEVEAASKAVLEQVK